MAPKLVIKQVPKGYFVAPIEGKLNPSVYNKKFPKWILSYIKLYNINYLEWNVLNNEVLLICS